MKWKLSVGILLAVVLAQYAFGSGGTVHHIKVSVFVPNQAGVATVNGKIVGFSCVRIADPAALEGKMNRELVLQNVAACYVVTQYEDQ